MATVTMYSEMHMENMLEIGRIIQHCFESERIEYYDSKEMYHDARRWAVEFEDVMAANDDYYLKIYEFTMVKLKEKFGEF